MTEPKAPIDALDEQERELARVLRALPGGEPPAALDQKILRAAANAAASSRSPRARWLASVGSIWGIGGAAAAVLALGITWQMMDPGRPDSAQRSQPVPVGATDESAITVDLGESSGELAAPAQAAAADAPAAAARDTVAPSARPSARVASPAPARPAISFAAPAPPPPPPAGAAAANSALGGSSDTGFQGEASKASAAAEIDNAPMAAAQHAQAQSAEQARARSETAAGQLADASQAPTAATGAKAMTPAVWLARIRKLKAENQPGEARNSLELFHQYYPQYVIPADLAPLLRE